MASLHCTLATRDIRRPSGFFTAPLGGRPIERPGTIPMAAAWPAIAEGQEQHVVGVPNFEPSRVEGGYGRHVAVSDHRGGFAELKDRMTRHGAEVIATDRPAPFGRFFFRDPSGSVFEVIEAGRA